MDAHDDIRAVRKFPERDTLCEPSEAGDDGGRRDVRVEHVELHL